MMVKPKTLITAAGGNTGFATSMQLLECGYPVRALFRRPGRKATQLRDAGAEIVIGSMTDLRDMSNAMKGAQRAYFCPPWAPNMLYYAMVFAVAAREARLESAVVMSQWLADPEHHAVATRQSWLMEQALPWIPGVGVTIVNPGFFADNYMQLLEPVAQLGILPLPLGEGLNAPPSNEDIARVVAGALAAPEKHAGKTFRPTGPRLLSPGEIAGVFSRVLGRTVRYMDIPEWVLPQALRVFGMDPFTQSQVRVYMREYRRNAFAIGAPSEAVFEVSGRQAEDFETTVRCYVAERPEARPGLGNLLKAVIRFLRIPLTPAFDLDQLARVQDHPKGRRSVLAIESERWIATHGGRLIDREPLAKAPPGHVSH